jgi:hypothetical protein
MGMAGQRMKSSAYWLLRLLLAFLCTWSSPLLAATCSPATSQGTAPPEWQTYCWLDLSSYNDTTARSASGQGFSFMLSDGSTLSFNVKTTPVAAPVLVAKAAPSWTGAAVGNTAFLGIPGMPILYQQAGGTDVVTFSGITITPPAGVPAVTAYSFVAADAESTNNGESLSFTTNGTGWAILDQVNPISGSIYPTISGVGTATFTETGVAGTVGGYIVGSSNPTTVTTTLVGGGLQGAMFAVRFASMRLTKVISGTRVNPADQFTFDVKATSSGAVLGSGTTSGTGLGPFAQASVSLASGLPLTLSEVMAAGSSSTLSQYRSTLDCINGATGSSTPLPSGVVTTSYNFGPLQFGDAIRCTFTNIPFPHVTLQKSLGAGGRRFNSDQFVMNIMTGATSIASTTTTGSGSTITNGVTTQAQVTAGTPYSFSESASGSTNLSQYGAAMLCSNASTGSITPLVTTVPGTITPAMGDVITCTITNTKTPANANLTVAKYATLVSDPVNNNINPKMIPGAIVRYSITITNTGTLPVDASSITVVDPLPTAVVYDAASLVTFSNGTPTSGLSAFNPSTMVSFSSQPSGGAPFTYVPIAGYDPNVKGIRIVPSGTMSGATGAGQPSFTLSFLAQIK